MKIAIAEMDMVWEDKERNQKIAENMVADASRAGARLIVFPEMTLTGFSMKVQEIAEENKETFHFFQKLSGKYQIGIGFDYAKKMKQEYYNCFTIVDDQELKSEYDKIHPFSMGYEAKYYQGGHQLTYAVMDDITIGTFICYDLRFPEIFMESSKRSEVMIVSANWPKQRLDQWDVLLRARAIETESYVVGVNRMGNGGGIQYCGGSKIYDPEGNEVPLVQKGSVWVGEVQKEVVKKRRLDFPVRKDRKEALYRTFYE